MNRILDCITFMINHPYKVMKNGETSAYYNEHIKTFYATIGDQGYSAVVCFNIFSCDGWELEVEK